jgi:hypothetical protein
MAQTRPFVAILQHSGIKTTILLNNFSDQPCGNSALIIEFSLFRAAAWRITAPASSSLPQWQ